MKWRRDLWGAMEELSDLAEAWLEEVVRGDAPGNPGARNWELYDEMRSLAGDVGIVFRGGPLAKLRILEKQSAEAALNLLVHYTSRVQADPTNIYDIASLIVWANAIGNAAYENKNDIPGTSVGRAWPTVPIGEHGKIEFFFEHAGYSRKPRQSETAGKAISAVRYSRAEELGRHHGYRVEWTEDPDADLSWASPEQLEEIKNGKIRMINAYLFDEDGSMVEGMGGIAVTGNDDPYMRVVAAELMMETDLY